MLIALRWYQGGPTEKALVAGSNSLGLLAGPLVVFFAARWRQPSSQAAALLAGLGSFGFLLAAFVPSLNVFILGAIVGIAAQSATVPLNTQMYQDNYPAPIRGRLYSRTNTIKIFASIIFGTAGGYALSGNLQYFPFLMCIFAAASAYASRCLRRCPTAVLDPERQRSPWSSFRFVVTDRLFRQLLVAWMLMGIGNLMMLPLRVEYLASPEHGLHLSEAWIALLVTAIPSAARLLLSPIWGRLFDHGNFFVVRAAVNVGFLSGILTFFCSDSIPGLVAGSIIFGVANAGGDIAWNLWVTKFAPPERVAEYMSVHTFMTGVRGMLAPLLSFHLLGHFSLVSIASGAAGLIFLSIALLAREIRSAAAQSSGT